MKNSSKIEAILFIESEPFAIKKLADILEISKEEVDEAILELKNDLEGRGLVLIENNDHIVLKTHPDMSDLLMKIQKDEVEKELTKSALETLSIICYHQKATKSEIDYIRGVNSAISLRTLTIRGLIEKKQEGKNNYYTPSIDLLSSLGITDKTQLQDFEQLSKSIAGIIEKPE